jgi:Holliday junction resolvase
MNTKAKGSRRERRAIALLEAAGYRCTRAAASLGTFDVVAVGPRDVKLLQVKSGRWPGSVELEAIQLFACPSFVSKEVWRWNDYARQPVVKVVG